MAFAPTRSGKGVGLVVPTLLSWTGSAVIHDIKGENWQLTAGWRSRFSHALLFNPTDARSAHYNPLIEVRRGENEVRDAQNIADILVDPEGALERRNHWEKTSHSLLVGAILHILYAEEEKTLARVATFLSDPQRPFVVTLKRMMTTNHLGTQDAPLGPSRRRVGSPRGCSTSPTMSAAACCRTAMSFLGLYRDPTVAEGDIALRLADRRPGRGGTAGLALPRYSAFGYQPHQAACPPDPQSDRPPPEPERLDGVGAAKRNHKLLMMLDEFPALGRLDFFETSLAFMAGYGVRAFLIAQSLNQIEKAYGEHNSILDNCHVRVAFATNDERTARRISDALGTATGTAIDAQLCRAPARAPGSRMLWSAGRRPHGRC